MSTLSFSHEASPLRPNQPHKLYSGSNPTPQLTSSHPASPHPNLYPQQTVLWMMQNVDLAGYALAFVSAPLKADRHVVLTAVASSEGAALELCADHLQVTNNKTVPFPRFSVISERLLA